MNMQTDVLHSGNVLSAEITGHKYIGHLAANDISTQYANGIDLNNWFENSVKVNSPDNQEIADKVTFKGRVRFYDNVQIYGTVNGIRISSENILDNATNYQVINGDVIINTLSLETNQMKQVFIKNLKLKDDINGNNWNEFHQNAFTIGTRVIDSKRIVFEKELQIDHVWTNKSIYGTDMAQFLRGSSASSNMIKFQHNMEHLTEVCDDLMRSLGDKVVELSHYEHHQSIPGKNIQTTVLFSIENGETFEYALAVHERNEMEMINFYHWNRTKQLFEKSQKLTSLQYNSQVYQVTQFHKIRYAGTDRLFVELFDLINSKFVQMLLHYDPLSKSFVPFIQTQDDMSMKIFTWSNGSTPCYGSIFQSFENIIINCEKYPKTLIKTRPIKKISSHDDVLIFLTDNESVKVWYNSKFFNLPPVTNPQSFTSIKYNDKIFLAVRSDKFEGTNHNGQINVFVSSIHEMKFSHLQKLTPDIPVAMEFSKTPSGDLMLYILSKNPMKALRVFTYAGSSSFVELTDNTIISEASDMDVIQIDNNSEVLSVVSGDNVHIIQAVLIEY